MASQPLLTPRLCHAAGLCIVLVALLALPVSGSAAAVAQDDNGGATILAAGDIGTCDKSLEKRFLTWWRGDDRYFGAPKTAALLERLPGKILILGDVVYPYDGENDASKCFEPTWGRFKDRIAPVPGNHDIGEVAGPDSGPEYYDYWGAEAGDRGHGFYSFPLGAWHVVALNSELDEAGLRAQEAWLRRDLAAATARCILAYWHRPVFSSGKHGDSAVMGEAYRILYDSGASVVLAGHDHDYERFAPLDPDGNREPDRGIRSFVVGTGGHELTPEYEPRPNSESFDNTTWGVLQMTLFEDRYTWRFVPVDGREFSDSGSGRCVERTSPRAALR